MLTWRNLFPILDSRLVALYRAKAEDAGRSYPELANGKKQLYWLAVREDVMENRSSLENVRGELRGHGMELVRAMAGLSDVRLLDILAGRM